MKKIFLSLMALMTVVTASSQSLQGKLDEGSAAYSAKDFKKAATLLEAVIDEGMDDESAASIVATAKTYLPKCFYMLGGGAAKRGDFDAARENFLKAADYAELYDDIPTMTKAKTWAGKTYELQGGRAFNDKDYATALPIFESGYAMDPRNTKMANWLGICYCETGNFEKGMDVFSKVAAMGSNPRYAADAEQAEAKSVIYTNNRVAELQKSKDYDGVIAMADALSAKDPQSAIAAKVRLQAYSDKQDYAKVFSSADSAAALQTTPEEKSNIYFILGAAYNAKEMKDEAIAAFKKVTAGANAATAKTTIAELSK
ncbi:MAG: tetratricopeptide repeat protein [Rikenellaceae bacterium]